MLVFLRHDHIKASSRAHYPASCLQAMQGKFDRGVGSQEFLLELGAIEGVAAVCRQLIYIFRNSSSVHYERVLLLAEGIIWVAYE